MRPLILALALIATPAFSHSWYDTACCSGKDCTPVGIGIVTPSRDGWHISIRPGDHPLVTFNIDEIIPFDDPRIRDSQDLNAHVCIHPYYHTLQCVYVPAFGS